MVTERAALPGCCPRPAAHARLPHMPNPSARPPRARAPTPRPSLQRVVLQLQQQAAAGDATAQQLRLALVRLGAAVVVESCDRDVLEALQLFLLQQATAK